MNTVIRFKPWTYSGLPKRILAIRYQALGDTIITLPYLLSIKNQYPQIEIHFLTRKEVDSIPRAIKLFDKIFSIGGGRNAKLQFILSLFLVPKLLLNRYDVVLDLQNNKITRIIRRLLFAKAWTEFDRESPISAALRTQNTINSILNWKIPMFTKFAFRQKIEIETLLNQNGWKHDHDLIVLNPAGFCQSRNWPLEMYVDFCKLWQKHYPKSQFVLLLLPSLENKADFISQKLVEHCINLTGKTNQVEAFAILSKCKFVLTEDSGLMHMAWVQGVPTLALFSSSRKDWSAPQGSWSDCLDSSDLECGPCMKEVCQFGDNRCLTRYSPEFVFERAKRLMQ